MFENYQQELLRQSNELIAIAREYAESRRNSSMAEEHLDIEMAKYGDKLRGDRKSLSKENMLIELLKGTPNLDTGGELISYNINEENSKNHKILLTEEANYKGLEKVMDAIKTRIMTLQSIMKYDINGEYGNHE